MNEQIKTPIDILTESLAVITFRAMEAERKMELAQKQADDWYKNWQKANDSCAALQDKLEALSDTNAELRRELKEVRQALKEEKDAHAETWRRCKDLAEFAVKTGLRREEVEAFIYDEPEALPENGIMTTEEAAAIANEAAQLMKGERCYA